MNDIGRISQSSTLQNTRYVNPVRVTKTPAGLSQVPDSLQIEFKAQKGILRRAIGGVFHVFVYILKSIKGLFYRLIFCKAMPSDQEYRIEKLKLMIDSLKNRESPEQISDELARKQAQEIEEIEMFKEADEPTNSAYTKLGRSCWWRRLKNYVSNSGKTFTKIGEEAAKDDYTNLLPHLIDYYETEIRLLQSQLKKDDED